MTRTRFKREPAEDKARQAAHTGPSAPISDLVALTLPFMVQWSRCLPAPA